MDHTTNGEGQKEAGKTSAESGAPNTQLTSDTNKPAGRNAPADRDAGSLDHGETGGNFGEDTEEGKTS